MPQIRVDFKPEIGLELEGNVARVKHWAMPHDQECEVDIVASISSKVESFRLF